MMPTRRRVRLRQEIEYRYTAPVQELQQRLRTVPPARHAGQRRASWEVRVRGAASWTTSHVDGFGNLVVDVYVPRVADAVVFAVEVELEVDEAGRAPSERPDPRLLELTDLCMPDDRIRSLALTAADGAAALTHAVHTAMTYEWGVTDVATPAAAALAGGRGVCQDYAHIMLAACRSAGLPARYVSGHLPGEGGSHAWVEVMHPDPDGSGRWIPEGWDPTHDQPVHEAYIVVATGRDYRDVAPMSGTFVGEGVAGSLAVAKTLEVDIHAA
jgi:transglutaminase-like putative cysteine protease